MCNIWKKKDHSDELTTEELEKFFRKAGPLSWIDLCGGEIFLRKDILDVVKVLFAECKDLFLLHYATNGFLVDKTVSTTEKILAYGPKKLLVTVSLDGDRELHEKIRGVPGSFDKTLKTFSELRRFNAKNFKVFLGMTLFDENSSRFPDTYRSVKEVIPDISYDDFHLNIMQLSDLYYDNRNVNVGEREKILDTIRDFREKSRKGSLFSPVDYLESRYQSLANRFFDTGKCPLPCQALSNSCFIGPNGDIHPCTMYEKRVANLREFNYDLKAAWKSTLLKEIRDEIRSEKCPHCWTPCEAYQTIMANFFSLRKIFSL